MIQNKPENQDLESLAEIFEFRCEFCGKNYKKDPIRLALHIARNHDIRPNSSNYTYATK